MPTMNTSRLAATLVSITLAAAAGGALAQDRMRAEGDSGSASNKLSQPNAPRATNAMKNSETVRAATLDRMRAEGDSSNPENKLSQPR